MANRRHSKISDLPPELLAQIDQFLLGAHTVNGRRLRYAQITQYVRAKGHDVSPAGVGRYAKGRLAELERVKLVSDQMKSLRESIGDDALALQEGTVQYALSKMAEYLTLLEPGSMLGEEANKIFRALAELQKSSVAREKLKMDVKKKAAAAADTVVQAVAKAKGVSDETADWIKAKILEIAA